MTRIELPSNTVIFGESNLEFGCEDSHDGSHDSRPPDTGTSPIAPEQLHTQVETLTDKGVQSFVFARDGRVLDAGSGFSPSVIEQLAATCSGLVNIARHYAAENSHEGLDRLVVRFTDGALILLPVTPAVWVGAEVDREQVKDTAHTLALFANQVAHLVPDQIARELQVMPSVLVGAR
ncbi:roadblock/LC7 domain-containing protein [Nocardiopsis nanhaiensis]